MTTRMFPLDHELEPALGSHSDGLSIPKRRIAPVVDVGDDIRHALLKTDLGTPTKLGSDAADISPRAVGLSGALWNIGNLAAQQFDQTIHRLRFAGAKVVHAANLVDL